MKTDLRSTSASNSRLISFIRDLNFNIYGYKNKSLTLVVGVLVFFISMMPEKSLATNVLCTWSSVSASNNCPGNISNYTLNATLPNDNDAAIAAGKSVVITFPSGFTLNSITGGTFNTRTIGAFTATATTISFVVPASGNVAKNNSFTIVLNGITNTITGGDYQLSMVIDNATGIGAGNQNIFAQSSNSQFTLVNIPAITSQPSISGQNLCQNISASALSVIATGGGLSYQWYSNTIASNSAGSAISGATASTYTPSTSSAGTLYYYVIVTGTCSPSVTSNISGGITVNAVPAVPSGTNNARCGTGTLVISASAGAGETIDWYAATSGGSVLSGGTGTTSFTTASISATTTYYAETRNTTTGCISATRTAVFATVNAVPVSPTLSVATPASGSTICAGFNTGTVTGTGGSGGSTGATNEYQVSINGGSTYSTYTNSAPIITTGATGSIIVQSRRTGGIGTDCTTSPWSTISTWTVGTATVNPTLNIATPASGNTICAGFSVSATITSGSGGSTGAADTYEYSINNGSTWLGYTSGNSITTTGATGNVLIRVSRSAGSFGCSATGPTTIVTWPVASTPVSPALSAANPASGSIICAGFNTGTVTGAGGSGGSTGAVNEYQFSINGGSTYSTYTNGDAIVTTGATGSIIIQSRRTAGIYGCTASSWTNISTWTLATTPVSPTLSAANPASGSTICAGYNIGTVTGAGGSGGSTGAANEYQVSIDGGGTYSTYTSGSAINTTGATGSIIVQSRRTAGIYGCTESSWTTISSWTLATSPVSPTLSVATPVSGSTICAGYNTGTVTGTGGSGGSTGAANEYQFSINGGSTYSAYTNSAAIVTTGATGSIIVQSRRTAGIYGCSNSAWSTISTWTVGTATVNPTLNVATPANGNTICAGFSVSATITAGSGGSTGAVDLYEYSINNGSTWFAYTSGSSITTTGATGNVLIRASRSAGSFGCSATGPTTIVTWSVASTPVSPTLSAANPASGSTICAGYNTGIVTGTGGSGGSTGAANEYQVSINGGSTYSAYTNSAAIITTGATGSIIVQSRRTAGIYGCLNSTWSTISTWTVGTATVNPTLNIATPASGNTICAGFSVSATITSGSGGSTGAADTYEYSINNGSTWLGYTSGNSITTTGATGNVLIRVSRSAGSFGCSATGPTTIVTWPVASTPVSPALSAANPASGSTICAGFNTGTVTGAGGSGGSTGAVNEYQFSINGGSTYSTYTNGDAIVTTGATGSIIVQSRRTAGIYGCSASSWVTISTWTVAPPTPSTPGAITGTASQCPALTSQTYSITAIANATTYNWTLPTGWSITAGAGSTSITVTTGGTGQNGNISVTAGNSCGTSSANTLAVTINSITVISTQPSDISVCVGSTATFSVGATGTGLIYQWQLQTNGTGPFNNISGANLSSYTTASTTLVMSDHRYKVNVIGSCGTVPSLEGKLTVIPTVGTPSTPTPSATTICQGSANTTYTTSATTATSYNWSVTTSAGNMISSTGTTGTVSWNPTFVGDATITVTANGCNSPSAAASTTVTVRPTPTATISGTTTVCQSGTATIIITNPQALPVTVTYNINGGTNSNINVAANSSATIAAPTTTAGTFAYNLVSVFYQSGTACSNTISGTQTVTVVAQPTVTAPGPASQIVCTNGTIGSIAVTASGGTGTFSYQWFSNATNSNSGGTSLGSANGAQTATYTAPATATVGVRYYYVTISQTGSGCGPVSSATASVTVVAQPTVTAPSPTSQTVCTNGTIGSITVTASGGTGTFSYQWFSNATNSNSGGTSLGSANGAQTAAYTPPATAIAGTIFYYAVISQTGSGCGPVSSATASVTVVAQPTVTAPGPASQTVCPNGTIGSIAVTASGGTGTFSYQWFSNTTNSNSGGTSLGSANGAQTAAYTAPATLTLGAKYYYVTISQNGSGCGSVSSATASVLVEDLIAPVFTCPAETTIVISTYSCAATVTLPDPTVTDNCSGAVISSNAPASFPVGNTAVTWTATDLAGNTTSCIQLVKVIKGLVLVNFSYSNVPQGPAPIDIAPSYIATGVTGNQPLLPAVMAKTSVINDGTVTGPLAFIPNNTAIPCLFTDFASLATPYYQFDMSGLRSYKNYQLYFQYKRENNSNPDKIDIQYSINGGAFISGLIINIPNSVNWEQAYFNLAPITAVNNQDSVSFRLVFDNGGSPKVSFDNFQFTAQNDEAINATVTGSNVTCNGGTNGTISINNTTQGIWEYSINAGAINTYQSSPIFTGLAPGSYDVRMRLANSTDCAVVLNAKFLITEPPVYTATITSSNVKCFGASTGTATVVATGGTAFTSGPAYLYSWSPSGGNAATATGLAAGIYTVTVTDTLGCIKTATVTITQPPTPLTVPVPSKTDVNCSGLSTGSATAAPTGGTGAGTYTYSWNTIPVQTTATAGNLPAGTYTVAVTDENGTGCTVVSAPITIIELNTTPVVTISGTNTVCSGTTNTYTAAIAPTGGTDTHTWSIFAGTATISGSPTGSSVNIVSPTVCATTTFTIRDIVTRNGCSNFTDHIVTVNPPPVAVLAAAPGPITVACGGIPAASTLSFSNGMSGGCEINGISNPSTFSSMPSACGGTVTETWTATDLCGRALAPVTRTITVSPAALPIMTAPGPIIVACGAIPAASTISFSNGLSGGCEISGTSNASTFTATPAACGGTVTETWTATDACGRVLTPVSRTITVSLAALPTMTAPGPITVACGAVPAPSTISFSNGLSAGCLISGTSNASTFTATPDPITGGTITETWTATDGCGRALASVSRTITVNPAPVLGTPLNTTDFCVGVGSTGTLSVPTFGGISYQWWFSTDNVNWNTVTNDAVYSNASTSTLSITNPPLMLSTYFYRVNGTGTCINPQPSDVTTIKFKNVWVGNTNTDWNTITNWSDNNLPSVSCPDVYILGSRPNQPTLSTGVATIQNINIQPGAILTVTTGELQIAGTITNSGVLDLTKGKLALNGSSIQTIAGSIFMNRTLKSLSISNNVNIASTANDTLNILDALLFENNSIAVLNTGNNLTLKSTATGTARVGPQAVGNAINGNVIVERHLLNARKWRLLSAPTSDATQSIKTSWLENRNTPVGYGFLAADLRNDFEPRGFDVKGTNSSVKVYNGVTDVWDPLDNANMPISNYQGYMVFVPGDRNVVFPASNQTNLRSKGKLYTQWDLPTITVPTGQFKVIGNPFASPIDMRKVGKTNIDDAYYVWDPRLGGAYSLGGYVTFFYDGNDYRNFFSSPTYPAGKHNLVESGLAFIVKSFTGGTISFTEAAKSDSSTITTTPTMFSPGFAQKLKLELNVLYQNNYLLQDGIMADFDVNYSNAVDRNDIHKMQNTGESISWKTAQKLLVIDRRAEPADNDTLHIQMDRVKVQSYQWKLQLENMDYPGRHAYLVDKYTQAVTMLDMAGPTTVNFNVVNIPGSYAADRFKIVFKQQGVLPVTFVSVQASRNADRSVAVQWKVANEVNIQQYEIERSADGTNFAGIITRAATGNNGSVGSYTDNDLSPLNADNFYRIKATSLGGQVQYSAIVKTATVKTGTGVYVYPNPVVKKQLNIQFNKTAPGDYSIQLSNQLGQQVYAEKIKLLNNALNKSIQLNEQLGSGTYYLKIIHPSGFSETQTIQVL